MSEPLNHDDSMTNSKEAAKLLNSNPHSKDDANANVLDSHKQDGFYVKTLNGLDGDHINLLHSESEIIPVKDFAAEVRALKDVQSYLDKAVLLLNLQKNSLHEIVETMVDKVLRTTEKKKFDFEKAKSSIFTAESGENLAQTIQGIQIDSTTGCTEYDQSWICILCDIPSINDRYVAIARLAEPTNINNNCQECRFIILILTPSREKMTKGPMEIGRTFATLFMDLEFRYELLTVPGEKQFKHYLDDRAKDLIESHSLPEFRKSHSNLVSVFDDPVGSRNKCPLFQGLIGDIKRRLPHYLSDYKDGIFGKKTPHKVVAAILFLYFACVLPNVAFGMLNSNNTHGVIGVKKVLFSQAVGGVLFAVFGGQPLIVLLTTAPLALYTKIIFTICEDFDLSFEAMFSCVGIWNTFFLLVYSIFDVSKLMKFSSRSTEEIFSVFITFAFSADAIVDTIHEFNKNYNTEDCNKTEEAVITTTIASNITTTLPTPTNITHCLPENSILFLFLMLGTLWLGLTLFNFTKTPYLNAGKREILADYALPVAVLIMSFIGTYVFSDIKLEPFQYNPDEEMFVIAPLHKLPIGAVLASAGLGFSLSLLFFMDQNISSALVNTPNHRLKKGAAYHWDLFVVAIINLFLSVFTFPWVHAALPHSPLHVRALADIEERVEQGHVHQIVVNVRETRLTGIISHVMIGLSVLLLPQPLSYIPRAVLDGLFLYVAISALYGNQFFDRILLLFTEQVAYPPNHYIRRVPQKKIHTFTGIQVVQLVVLCVFGFSTIAYMKMIFPILLMFLMPIRHKLVPKVIEQKYLKALDGH
ncbi:hypothetical protein LOTGIDRAFT_216724 [Lottia gigantea]|uniref:Bicarbonate transporter-like transmembrane domain-containing protein n=1 Tax=Lottia gigantea TaxID=225164 RepID=V4ABZ6_LOTGI|nr:hypothetical protein LOTGIDRAFT_216724 [Lottia gigantea]ESO92620.1 hypothetical protein LOTGIDRAFT_216724 [Lottia gigantea]